MRVTTANIALAILATSGVVQIALGVAESNASPVSFGLASICMGMNAWLNRHVAMDTEGHETVVFGSKTSNKLLALATVLLVLLAMALRWGHH
jgi:hypothetical protein